MKRNTRYSSQVRSPYWPDLETKLLAAFMKRREAKKIVKTWWFREQSKRLFAELYPEFPGVFTFSYGWFRGFLKRNGLVLRRITKMAQKLPVDFERYVLNFIRRIRKMSQPLVSSENEPLYGPYNKFLYPPSMVMNWDETPIPFEYLDGSTYSIKGSHTVAGHTDRSGWNKRQATLVLYVFADGVGRLLPKLIFHGTPTEEDGRIESKENALYHPGVTVS